MAVEPLDPRRLEVPLYEKVLEYGPRRWELVKKTIGYDGAFWETTDKRVGMPLDDAYRLAREGSHRLPATWEQIALYVAACRIVKRALLKYARLKGRLEREWRKQSDIYWAARRAAVDNDAAEQIDETAFRVAREAGQAFWRADSEAMKLDDAARYAAWKSV